jgi:hypothetical protein
VIRNGLAGADVAGTARGVRSAVERRTGLARAGATKVAAMEALLGSAA